MCARVGGGWGGGAPGRQAPGLTQTTREVFPPPLGSPMWVQIKFTVHVEVRELGNTFSVGYFFFLFGDVSFSW